MVTEKIKQNSSDAFDIAVAHQAYFEWERENAQELGENQIRRRSVDLSIIVHDVIEEDLSEIERKVVEQYWFEQKSISEIAAKMNVNRATSFRTLERANSKMQKILRHVIKYQYDLKNVDFIPIVVREALAVAAVAKVIPENIGQRLRKLRMLQNIPTCALSKALNIQQTRLEAIENGLIPSIKEVIKLAAFFKTTTDHILIGG